MSFEDKQKKVKAIKKEALLTIQQIDIPENVDECAEYHTLEFLFGDIPRDIEWSMDSLLDSLTDFREEYASADTWTIENDI